MCLCQLCSEASHAFTWLLMISGFLHLVWKTFTVRQVRISSAHTVLSLVPNEEKSCSRSIGSFTVQKYAEDSIIRMKSHVNRYTWLVLLHIIKWKQRQRDGMQLWREKMCEYEVGKSMEGSSFQIWLWCYVRKCEVSSYCSAPGSGDAPLRISNIYLTPLHVSEEAEENGVMTQTQISCCHKVCVIVALIDFSTLHSHICTPQPLFSPLCFPLFFGIPLVTHLCVSSHLTSHYRVKRFVPLYVSTQSVSWHSRNLSLLIKIKLENIVCRWLHLHPVRTAKWASCESSVKSTESCVKTVRQGRHYN